MNNSNTKILLAEDHQMFRLGLKALFEKCTDIELIDDVEDGMTAVKLATEKEPDVVLMDIDLPVLNGVDACRQIIAKKPKVGVLAFSMNDQESAIINMVKAGARGYILKNATFEELQLAIKTLARQGNYFSTAISGKLFAQLNDARPKPRAAVAHRAITIRELEVLKFVAEELSNSEIAARLFISPRTVETHKRNLIQKLKVRNTIGLVKYYLSTQLSSNSA
ncbi:MAG: response regulator transcription factor [Bacteroidota bacterium]